MSQIHKNHDFIGSNRLARHSEFEHSSPPRRMEKRYVLPLCKFLSIVPSCLHGQSLAKSAATAAGSTAKTVGAKTNLPLNQYIKVKTENG